MFAFDQGEDGRTALPAQYKVGFPVAGTASAMDDLRALLDAHAARQQAAHPPRIAPPSSFAMGLPQVLIERAPVRLSA